VFIYPDGKGEGSWLIEVDAKEVEKLAKHIKRYKLRAKFEVKVLEVGERDVWSLWEDEGKEWTAHSFGGQSNGTRGEGAEVGCVDTRAPGMGRRLILTGNQKPEVEMEETSGRMSWSERVHYRRRAILTSWGPLITGKGVMLVRS
jgi:folate-binding Fe-S cluster repair protein YgfZ